MNDHDHNDRIRLEALVQTLSENLVTRGYAINRAYEIGLARGFGLHREAVATERAPSALLKEWHDAIAANTTQDERHAKKDVIVLAVLAELLVLARSGR